MNGEGTPVMGGNNSESGGEGREGRKEGRERRTGDVEDEGLLCFLYVRSSSTGPPLFTH